MNPRRLRSVRALLAAIAVNMALASCEGEPAPQRTVRNVFDGMPGMQRGGGDGLTPVEQSQGSADPGAELAAIVVTADDGTVKLKSPLMRHALYHFRTRMISGESELLTWQVLAQTTRDKYANQGSAAEDAAADLLSVRADVLKTLARMPNGENSPNVLVSKEGPKLFVLRLVNTAARNMRFSEIWLELEGQDWKVVWVR